MKRALTQQEIDSMFGRIFEGKKPPQTAEQFDFRKLDKLSKSQVLALHLLHEDFTRNLGSSLSAYLRSYVPLSLVSLEQISYGDFLEGVSNPACLAYLGLNPFDGFSVLDISLSLAFRFIELLLGSREQSGMPVQRKMTEIEKKLLHTVLRLVVHHLRESWKSVAEIDFDVQSLATEPQLPHGLAPSEAMVVIAFDVQLGSTSGLMNLALPSLFLKRLKTNFEQLQKVRKAEASEADQLHMGKLLKNLRLDVDVRIPGGNLEAKTLLELTAGDVLLLDHAADEPLHGLINERERWTGRVQEVNGGISFEILG